MLGNIQTLQQLIKLLSPYFAPASLVAPPIAQGTSGGRRTVAFSSQLPTSENPPIQVAVAALVAGTYPWTYPQAFNKPPVVVAFPVGADSGKTLYLATAPSNKVAIINSDDAADTRFIHLVAIGNPS